MLRLPELDRLPEIPRAHFQRFLATGIAKDLDSEEAGWTVVSWPRVEGFPARFILRNDNFDEVELTFFEASRYTHVFRERPPAISPRLTAA